MFRPPATTACQWPCRPGLPRMRGPVLIKNDPAVFSSNGVDGCRSSWLSGLRRRQAVLFSGHGAVVEVDHAVAETGFVQQFELQADIAGKRLLAISHHDG